MWIYNSIKKKISFPESRKYCPVHHYHLKRCLLICQFWSIPSVKKFFQDFVPGDCKEIKNFSFSLNQEHFMEHITSFVHSFDPAKLFKAMRTFNISNHRSIDSSSFSPQMSNFALFLVLPFIPQQLVLIFIGVPIAKLPLWLTVVPQNLLLQNCQILLAMFYQWILLFKVYQQLQRLKVWTHWNGIFGTH